MNPGNPPPPPPGKPAPPAPPPAADWHASLCAGSTCLTPQSTSASPAHHARQAASAPGTDDAAPTGSISRSASPTPLPPPPPPARGPWLLSLACTALVIASFISLDLQWAAFLSPGALRDMADFIGSFFPPATDTPFLSKTLVASLETLAMSLLGTLLAAVFGLALAIPAARPGMTIPAAARLTTGLIARLLPATTRLVLNVLRAVPELVWAVLLLVAAGLGPMAGALALALHTTGVLGRLFAESIENAAPEPASALRQRGIGRARTLLWATLPQITPQLLSYTLYRWENNIRAAAILGVVGAGGLGQMLSFHLGLFHMHETATVLIAMLLLVGIVDGLSFAARRWLR